MQRDEQSSAVRGQQSASRLDRFSSSSRFAQHKPTFRYLFFGMSQTRATKEEISSACQFRQKPSSGHLPIAHNTLGRDLQHLCRFLDAEPSEEPKLDDLCFPWVDLS